MGEWADRLWPREGELIDKAELRDPRQQAGVFERVREAHRIETAEDYVELIADLIEANGEARAVDLAQRFGVSQATVNKVIARLVREGLVLTQRYRSIFLTPTGLEMAQRSRERHILVRRFFIAIGVDAETAEADAEGVEHHVSETTLKAMRRFLDDHS